MMIIVKVAGVLNLSQWLLAANLSTAYSWERKEHDKNDYYYERYWDSTILYRVWLVGLKLVALTFINEGCSI